MPKVITIEAIGNINQKGQHHIDEEKTPIKIISEDLKGMEEEKNIDIVQIGGPLGSIVQGEILNQSLVEFKEIYETPTLMVLNSEFCPVDFSKFILSYVKNEMKVTNDELTLLSQLIDNISSGNTTIYTYDELKSEISRISQSELVNQVRRTISYLIERYKHIFAEHVEDKHCDKGICSRLFNAQCINACPAEINIPGYIALMSEGRDEEAYRLMRRNNPLSLICGKICARPCESKCRRGEIEQTVGVRALKHYAATTTLDNKNFIEARQTNNGKKVAIIGAGPAGLSAAYYLAKTGYNVNIYEKHTVVGGLLAIGVPSYRLGQESINEEVKLIEALGVAIHKGIEVGKDIDFKALHDQNDSVLLSTGCHIPNLFSAEISNLEAAIDFLKRVALDLDKHVGDKVVVIGGGDVAMDASRTAIRLGAKEVVVVSLESYLQMPANDEEKEEATKEGINLINGFGTKEIHEIDRIANSITIKKCTKLYDINNRFAPVYDESKTLTIPCDHIILAIGQRSDMSYLRNNSMVDEKGRIIQEENMRTTLKGVYTAGDMTGPGSAIKAIAEGKQAAMEIDKYLGGEGLYYEHEIEIPSKQSVYSIWDTKEEKEEVQLFETGCTFGFEEYRQTYSKQMVLTEASRCMRCDRNSRQ